MIRTFIIKRLIFCSFLLFTFYFSYSQGNGATIQNVDFKLDANTYQIIVTYDIVNFDLAERFKINLIFKDNTGKEIIPNFISGDVGDNITGGKQKKIVWDILNENQTMPDALKASVTIIASSFNYGGPSKAFLSVLVPGLGDKYVRNTKFMTFKPFIRSASVYTILAAGIYCGIKGKIDYNSYLDTRYHGKKGAYWQSANIYNKCNYILTGLGVFLWAADIVQVAIIGAQNKNKQSSYLKIIPGCYVLNNKAGINIGLSYNF